MCLRSEAFCPMSILAFLVCSGKFPLATSSTDLPLLRSTQSLHFYHKSHVTEAPKENSGDEASEGGDDDDDDGDGGGGDEGTQLR